MLSVMDLMGLLETSTSSIYIIARILMNTAHFQYSVDSYLAF